MTDIAEIKDLYSKRIAIDLDDGKQKAFATRIKRAISWYDRAERETRDADSRVIFFWIAFNALYGEDKGEEHKSKKQQDKFLKLITKLGSGQIHAVIREYCPDEYTSIMTNRYICWKYWREIRSQLSNSGINRKQEADLANQMDKKWRKKDAGDKVKAEAFLNESECTEKKILQNLCGLFERIYELRNQIVHGNASWSADVNRSQVENGCRVLAVLIPTFIQLMLTEPKNVKEASRLFGGKVHRPPYRFWNKREYFNLDPAS